MIDLIVNSLKGIPKELIVVIVSMLPVAELRGAIPLALSFGMSMNKAFWLSVLGNLIFVVPALFLFEPVSGFLRKFKIWSRFFDWVFRRTQRKSDLIQKYEALGLVMFVAIPLPMTGAWSGVIAATLFKIKFRYAFIAITAGVFIAGFIVMSLCSIGMNGWKAVAH
ncbi:MAG: small multi-drug export protein [Candidatus Omnitrophica bacterium]|nr:small multi-drug export protein [Candidatus Omnitrophota bacterium]